MTSGKSEWEPVESIVDDGGSHRAEIQTRRADGMFRFVVSEGVWTRSADRAWSPFYFSGLYDQASSARRDAQLLLRAEVARRLATLDDLESSVKKVLWRNWDPIGVNDLPEAYGEYDSYAAGITALLRKGVTEAELRKYLGAIARDLMGIGDEPAATAGASALARLVRGRA
jgi:hypothetical protein